MKGFIASLTLSITAIILEFYAIYDVFARPTSQGMIIFTIILMTVFITIQLHLTVSMIYQYLRKGTKSHG